MPAFVCGTLSVRFDYKVIKHEFHWVYNYTNLQNATIIFLILLKSIEKYGIIITRKEFCQTKLRIYRRIDSKTHLVCGIILWYMRGDN